MSLKLWYNIKSRGRCNMISFADYKPELLKEIDIDKSKGFDPKKIGKSSTKKIWWKCKNGHSYYTSIGSRTRINGTGCPYCAGQKILPGYNDLQTRYPQVAKDWDFEKNYPLKPDEIMPGSDKKVWWKCKKGHSYFKAPNSRTNLGTGCPICANKEVLVGYNDLATINPGILSKWNYERNEVDGVHPTSVTPVSGKKVWWKCEKGHEWKATIAHIAYGRGCPICNTGKQTSFPEQAILYYISKIDNSCKSRYKINGRKELDIYMPKLKVGIEYDGYRWHQSDNKQITDIEKQSFWNNLGVRIIRIKEQSRRNTQLKDGDWLTVKDEYYLNDEDYPALSEVINDIIKELYDKTITINIDKDRNRIYKNYLFKETENSLANNEKTMKFYDWEKNLNIKPEYITRSSGKKLWWKCDKGHSFQATVHSIDNGKYCPICRKEVAKKNGLIPLDDKYIGTLKYSENIKSLLKEFPKISKEWNYEKNYPVKPENIVSRSHKKFWWKCSKCGYEWQATPLVRVRGSGCQKCGYISSAQKKYHPVLQFSKEGKFINEFDSIKEAIEKTGIKHISSVCRGERKTAGGFFWKYK